MAFRRYSPPNLPSLSQQDRVAWGGLTEYLPGFESSIRSKFKVFDEATRALSLTARDEFFTSPEVGETCITHTDGNVASTLWIYDEWLSQSGNGTLGWLPYDLAWTYFTPTMTNVTVGDGTATGRYRREYSLLHCDFDFTMGSTSAMGTNPLFSLPWKGLDALSGVGNGIFNTASGYIRDASGGLNALGGGLFFDSNLDTCVGQWVSHTAGPPARVHNAGITSTSPITWTTGDRIILYGWCCEMDIETVLPFTV